MGHARLGPAPARWQVWPGSGGMLGFLLKSFLQYYLKPVGAYILLCLLALVALLLATPFSLTRAGLALNAGLGRIKQIILSIQQKRIQRNS